MTTETINTPRAKFVELAEKRVTNALKSISLIGNLSSRSSYEYNKEDVAKIFSALEAEIIAVRKRFEHTPKGSNERRFTL